jgi:hypothetical protein
MVNRLWLPYVDGLCYIKVDLVLTLTRGQSDHVKHAISGRTNFPEKGTAYGARGVEDSALAIFLPGPPLFVCAHDSDCCIYWIPLSTLNQVKRMHARLKRLLHPSKQKGRNRS